MDFFDPQKQKKHAIRLAIGYALIGLAVVLATTVLLYQAYGYGINKKGQVFQNGLVFLSSQPSGAGIFLNGQRYKNKTNDRVTIPAGQYTVEIEHSGYRNWKRAITVEGGYVERFDYPFLFPTKLVTTSTKQYAAVPSLATQSSDRRWLLVGVSNSDDIDLYDLNASKPEPKALTIPADVLTAGSTTTSWQPVEWAGDNRHVLLKRSYQKGADSGSEYVLFDRQAPESSQNLSVLLGFTPTKMQLRGHNFDQYFSYDQHSGELFTTTLKKPTPQAYLDQVLAFDSDGDTMLYATTDSAPTGKVLIRMRQNTDTAYTLREVPAGTTYLLALERYKGTPYVVAGAANEDKMYVYQDPLAQLKDDAKSVLVPVQILKVANPTYVGFSPNARFAIAESSDHFAVYDAETDKGYAYQAKLPLDAPQVAASWMDGYHLTYVSGGHLVVFDFDGANMQTLSSANPSFLPFFTSNYHAYYNLTSQNNLSVTSLLVK